MDSYNNDHSGALLFIKDKVNQSWNNGNKPYLLSNVANDFKGFGDLKTIIKGQQLKAWLSDNQKSIGVKVLTHPNVKARVVIVPQESAFSFENTEPHASNEAGRKLTTKEITILFLETLGSLPQHDLEEVHIPAKVIAKLMR